MNSELLSCSDNSYCVGWDESAEFGDWMDHLNSHGAFEGLTPEQAHDYAYDRFYQHTSSPSDDICDDWCEDTQNIYAVDASCSDPCQYLDSERNCCLSEDSIDPDLQECLAAYMNSLQIA